MSAANTGAAQPVAPGRLAHFEDADDLDMAPAISLPPRRRPSAPEPANPTGESQNGPRGTLAEVPREADGALDEALVSDVEAVSVPQKDLKGPEDRVRPSNVHIPVALLAPLEAKCKSEGLSHGEVIIVALETTHPRLRDLVHPAATAGGSLFATRRSRASRSADGPLTPLNYRLREADFATLDLLVEDFGASSRGHLITAALADYFHDQL